MRVEEQNQARNEVNEEPVKETSIFFEKYAIWVLLFFLLIGLWFTFLPLIIISMFLIILSVLIVTWKKNALHKLEPAMQIPKTRLFAGDHFSVQASLKNNKWLPLVWVEWEFPKNENVIFGDRKQDAYIIRFLWFLSFQKVSWSIDGVGAERGVYDIGGIIVRSGDGFRFSETSEKYQLERRLYVYPRLMPVYVPPFRPTMTWDIKGKEGGYLEDPLLVNGVREYQSGDEIRKINWRATARTGKLHTNIYQPVIMAELYFIVDVKEYHINKEKFDDPIEQQTYEKRRKEEFEQFLAIVCSVAIKYSEQGVHIGFVTNGSSYYGERLPSLPPRKELTPLLDQLAVIVQPVKQPVKSVFDGALFGKKIPLVLFTGKVTENDYKWYQQHRQKLAEIQIYYKQKSEYSVKLGAKAKGIRSFLVGTASDAKGS